jgi:L-rhamnose mutarotase
MNHDEIVSEIISLIHSTTQSNYVICSQVSSKIFSYLAKIQLKDNPWNELNQAIEVKSFSNKINIFNDLYFSDLIKILIIQIFNNFDN